MLCTTSVPFTSRYHLLLQGYCSMDKWPMFVYLHAVSYTNKTKTIMQYYHMHNSLSHIVLWHLSFFMCIMLSQLALISYWKFLKNCWQNEKVSFLRNWWFKIYWSSASCKENKKCDWLKAKIKISHDRSSPKVEGKKRWSNKQ